MILVRKGRHDAFSLIEVTLALGVIAFALVALMGLLPTGLNSQQQAQEEAEAVSALNMVATAVRSAKFTGRANGNATYALPFYFYDDSAARWSNDPTQFWVTQPQWEYTFLILPDGTIRRKTDKTPAAKTLFLRVTPPPHEGASVRVYAAVAWPAKPADDDSTSLSAFAGRQGFKDTTIVYAPRNY
jgi:uncharacterized protein (TIGR02598 family)